MKFHFIRTWCNLVSPNECSLWGDANFMHSPAKFKPLFSLSNLIDRLLSARIKWNYFIIQHRVFLSSIRSWFLKDWGLNSGLLIADCCFLLLKLMEWAFVCLEKIVFGCIGVDLVDLKTKVYIVLIDSQMGYFSM